MTNDLLRKLRLRLSLMSLSCSFDSVFDSDTLVFYIENNIQITSGSQPDQTH